LFELRLLHANLLLLNLLAGQQLIIARLPKLRVILLLLKFRVLVELLLFNLVLARLLYCLLELELAGFFLFEDTARLLLSLSHLLIQNLLLFILKLRQVLGLFLNHLLSDQLLLLEALLFAVLLHLLKPLLLLRVVILLLLSRLFLPLQLLLVGLQLYVRTVQFIASASLPGFTFKFLDAVLL
jgi:hypothetical protein